MEILAYLATCQCRKDNRLLVLTNILLQYDYKILHSWPFLFWTNVQIWCCFLVSLLIPIPCVLSELAITSVTTVVATAVAIPEATIPAAWQAKKMRQILPWNIQFSMLLLHLQRFQVPSSLSSVCHAPSWRWSSHSSLNENSGVVMWSDTLTLMRPDRDIISGLSVPNPAAADLLPCTWPKPTRPCFHEKMTDCTKCLRWGESWEKTRSCWIRVPCTLARGDPQTLPSRV